MESDEFTRSYIRLIEQGRAAAWMPWRWKVALGCWRGRRSSFLRLREAAIGERLRRTLALDATQAQREFESLCASSGLAMHMVPHLPRLDARWIERNVIHEGQDGRDALHAEGGVVLTHHSYHHNLLASCFKGWDLAAYPVANPPAAFGEDDFLYRFTVDLNQKTEANLIGGGRFLYVDDRRALLKGIRQALVQRQVLYVLCDFDEDAPGNRHHAFLGGQLRIPTGVLKAVVAQSDAPVYFAGFRFDVAAKRYRLGWQRLARDPASPGGCEGLDAAYVAALQAWIQAHPHAWQGWQHT
ncbi:MAG: hypothetical protein EOO29_00790 [Comamonadaceae bacterium]|nr:MAG: hypothetical protein EOO29_00790 [Comamonadaceae bacterium]